MASPLMQVLCIFTLAFSQVLAESFYVAAPNTIRLGVEETVAIAHDGPDSRRVNLYLEDHPGRRKRFSFLTFDVESGKPNIVRIHVTEDDLFDAVFTNPNVRNYVALVVQSGMFDKEVIIPVTSKSGYVFVQTDKPIYTPRETVNIRVIPLNERTLPSREKYKLQIRNPQNVVVKEDTFNSGSDHSQAQFRSHAYKFSPDTLLGEWTVCVLYGSQFEHNTSVKFEVREYVLPTFVLKLETPNVVLPDDQTIRGKVTAEFVYKKKVQGYATFKFGVKDEMGHIVQFGSTGSIELRKGVASFEIDTRRIKSHDDIRWFPQISGKILVVEAIVTDFASGNQEVAVNANGKFSESPFVISFKRCLKDFKPGLVSVVQADINYVNGQRAAGVPVTISAVADGTHPVQIAVPLRYSDEEGRVTFLIQPEVQHSAVSVTLRTSDPNYGENQATANHLQQKFISQSNGSIAIERKSGTRISPHSVFTENIFFKPPEISNVYFMVVSRGVILLMKTLPKDNFVSHKVEFQVTYEMIPSFRLVVFAHYNNELIVDSLKVDVVSECSPNARVHLESEFIDQEPGSEGKIIIRGFERTLVGLLAVDEAVYALRNKDLLTKGKMFETIETHDLGCGPGGGRTTNIVMGNAGVVLMTSVFTPPSDFLAVPPCEEKTRRKREIVSEMTQNYTGKEKDCCRLGLMKHHSDFNCSDRAAIVQRFEPDNSDENCSAAFFECCLRNHKRISTMKDDEPEMKTIGTTVDDLDFVEIVDGIDSEEGINVRRDFRETWLFLDKAIGAGRIEEIGINLPNSITTWVIQAVSVSNDYGICVAEPQSVVAFQNVFLQLNLPYSVVRNEQIEIQAVVFNYGHVRLPVTVYMYGVENICSSAQKGQKSETKRIYVEKQSSHKVSFPIIPLKHGEYNIKVVALSNRGSDIIVKKLHVVPEGYPTEKNIVVKLDPTNQQKRWRREIETEIYRDVIDEKKKEQITSIILSVPEDFVPGTDSCVVSVIADEFGPTVETALQDPDNLIIQPRGCGEQNMIRFAPTLYTMRYLKVTGKLSSVDEEKGYNFIRQGYQRELSYRRSDGSYSAFGDSWPASTWLTAFVMKVFCQASEVVYIDEEMVCSGLKWLLDNQPPNGSFIDNKPLLAPDLMGGVEGERLMTAYVLITLKECSCDVHDLEPARIQAASFVESHLDEITEPLGIAIAAYALQLSNSARKDEAFRKLQTIEIYDYGLNTLHWETGHQTQDVHVTSYALLTYLLRGDMIKSRSIVNWLNSKRLAAGTYASTQDTVMALQALSEYAIAVRTQGVDLACNITYSSNRHIQKIFMFNDDNAHVQQQLKIDRAGGHLFVNTAGQGAGFLAVKLKYNIPTSPEKLCKFDIKINVTEFKDNPQPQQPVQASGGNDVFYLFDRDDLQRIGIEQQGVPYRIETEDTPERTDFVLNLQICVRYLGNGQTGMAIVDAGIFSGFQPNISDLKDLVKSTTNFIDKYEITSRSVVFYLDKITTRDHCFAFRIKREFIVGNTQVTSVRVYDYYNPEESCTEFYSPDNNSPMLRKICDGGICQCAEGGCPSKNPFEKVIKMKNITNNQLENSQRARAELLHLACNKNDYVWMGKPTEITRRDGFLRIHFHVDSVLKQGIEEKTKVIKRNTTELMARDNCKSAELVLHQTYLIMGKDGNQYQDDNGKIWNRYLLDKSTTIHKWTDDILSDENKFLNKALKFMKKNLEDFGCLD